MLLLVLLFVVIAIFDNLLDSHFQCGILRMGCGQEITHHLHGQFGEVMGRFIFPFDPDARLQANSLVHGTCLITNYKSSSDTHFPFCSTSIVMIG